MAIVGVGAVGTFLGYILNEGGVEPTLIFPTSETALRARELGVWLNLPDSSTVQVRGFISSYGDVKDSSIRIAFLCTKAYDVPKAAVSLRRKLAKGAVIISCQNGLGSLETLKKILPEAEVLGLILNCGIRREGESRFSLSGCSLSYLQRSSRFPEIAEFLSNMNFKMVQDIEPYRWLKLAVNAAVNPITAINMVNNGALLESPYLLSLASSVIDEVVSVGKAWGITMPSNPYEELKTVCSATSKNISSMLQDILLGNRTEVDFINGAVVGRALIKGAYAGVNRALWLLVKYMENHQAN